MRKEVFETAVGAAVVLIAVLFLVFGLTRSGVKSVQGYRVVAAFNSVGTLRQGADVRIGGIRVGSVTEKQLNPKTFKATLGMSIDSAVELPTDSSARILSEGLLGDSYVSIDIGGAEEMIGPGGRITITQDAIDVIELVSRVIFSGVKYEMEQQGEGTASGGGGSSF